jgi:aconitate hydratase
MDNEPLGYDPNGKPVFLRDVWPTQEEIRSTIRRALKPEMFREQYANVFDGNPQFNAVKVAGGDRFAWDPASTYIQEPPFFRITREVPPLQPIQGRAGARLYGRQHDDGSHQPRRQHCPGQPARPATWKTTLSSVATGTATAAAAATTEVMMRGTFANIRIKNQMPPGVEGGVTRYCPPARRWPSGMRRRSTWRRHAAGGAGGQGVRHRLQPRLGGQGACSCRVRAVIAESFERIHRSNLVGMGVLPLQFLEGESARSLGLTGYETYDILGLSDTMEPRQHFTVRATRDDGSTVEFAVMSRIDTPVEVNYYRNGGILQTVLRRMAE